ncbi:MAG TPA: serine hydrolase domain-containing protein [Kofleriaceae bacterium]
MVTQQLDTVIRSQTSSTTAASATRASPGGWSPKRIARMHEVMRRHVDNGQLPGVVTLVSRHGEVHVDAIGTLAFGSQSPMRRDALFRLASMTKPVTAVAAMILVEQCKLRLDDPVDEWLPELRDRKVLRTIDGPLDDTVPAKRPITLRDLLTFRSGYGEVMFVAGFCPLLKAMMEAQLPLATWPFPGTADEFMKHLGSLPLAHQPGERWLYHMAAEILGVLIARVSGMSLGQFLRERIFEPLAMTDTGFSVPEEKLDRLTVCYYTDPANGQAAVLDPARGGGAARPPVFESGGGGLVSTADDMLAFGRMMLNKGVYGHERILSRSSVELMTTDHITAEQKAASPFFPSFWDARGWGLGLSIIARRLDVAGGPGRFGWDGAFGTSWYVDPSEDLVGILMIQRRPELLAPPIITSDFWTSVYQALDD